MIYISQDLPAHSFMIKFFNDMVLLSGGNLKPGLFPKKKVIVRKKHLFLMKEEAMIQYV